MNLHPGCRALIVGVKPHPLEQFDGARYNGTVCDVQEVDVTDPFTPRIAGIGCVVLLHDGYRAWVPHRHLIPLPPDDLARQMFRETGKPREVAHG